jgi:hypothetical protein
VDVVEDVMEEKRYNVTHSPTFAGSVPLIFFHPPSDLFATLLTNDKLHSIKNSLHLFGI